MKSLFIFTLLCSSLLSNAERGQELYDQADCSKCHNPSDFTKKTVNPKIIKNEQRAWKSVGSVRMPTGSMKTGMMS